MLILRLLAMIDQVFAGEILLGHRPIPVVLVSDVPVQIDFSGNDSLTGQTDATRSSRYRNLTVAANLCKTIAFDNKRRILDRCAAVARDQTRALEYRHGSSWGLRRGQQESRQKNQAKGLRVGARHTPRFEGDLPASYTDRGVRGQTPNTDEFSSRFSFQTSCAARSYEDLTAAGIFDHSRIKSHFTQPGQPLFARK